ncbi:hypothetical protein ACFE04_003670 [Oxalis oulophora]
MKHYQEISLQRSNTYTTNTNKKITPYYTRSTSTTSFPFSSIPETEDLSNTNFLLLRRRASSPPPPRVTYKVHTRIFSLIRSLFNIIPTTTCKWLPIPTNSIGTLSLGRKVTGTLFGNRRGHVTFAVQDDPRSEPVLLLELAMSTSTLVKEMSSGLVRIALECESSSIGSVQLQTGKMNRSVKLFSEPKWSMYCNGRKCGYASSRTCGESDWHVLKTVERVSVGAGVIPMVDDGRKSSSEGELLYMRAKFERVVGSRDSEAFYMLNPDNIGGPELSIFLLRM